LGIRVNSGWNFALLWKRKLANMKVKIIKWNAVATWRWDIPEDDVCGICQVHFDGTCPTCKYPGDDCSLLSGKCGHNFHMHCIVEWIKQETSKGQCPMCRQKFEWTDDVPTIPKGMGESAGEIISAEAATIQ